MIDLDMFITLAAGFGANFALLWTLKDDIHKNKIEFAKCPLHDCGGKEAKND